jgi:transposase
MRRWSDEAEDGSWRNRFAGGAVVSEVARRHDISPRHLTVWLKAAGAGFATLSADDDLDVPAFRSAQIRWVPRFLLP